jgi:hypothetical protein
MGIQRIPAPRAIKSIRISILLFILAILLLVIPVQVWAQTYSFQMDSQTVDVYWNADGSASIQYVFVFTNDLSASPIDFVDVGLPNDNYSLGSITADVDGNPITDIEESPFLDSGVALGLSPNVILPGETGTVSVYIDRVERVMYPGTGEADYVSVEFSPTWFGSEFVHDSSDMTVTFHLPPGVQPEEPRWHAAPAGFPSEPETALDAEGRVAYTWRNPQARGDTQYKFGASFPEQYVPAESVVRPNPFAWIGPLLVPLLCIAFFAAIVGWGLYADRRRKLAYLPPKIAIEGHGIKRGLTAVEAGILMEQPMDKIMTMILFGVIKKNAAQVISRDPLEIEKIEPLAEDLQPYELDFLIAFEEAKGAPRRKALQKMMVDLVKGVGQKMRGFSRRETIAYYRDIMERAWAQVTAAETPEVKSEKYDEVMEWTMLDREYEGRTQEVFRGGPVYVPVWWPRYDPGYGGAPRTSGPTPGIPTPGPGGAGPSLPHLPGSDFAASVVNGVQGFASSVIGNVTEFTQGVTQVTNPPPKPTATSSSGRSRSGGGGGSSCACACACACAGCACACAGGGR